MAGRLTLLTFMAVMIIAAAFDAGVSGTDCPTGLMMCPAELMECTQSSGEKGFCHTTYLVNGNSDPFCDCLPYGNENDPDLHIPIYRQFMSNNVQLSASGDIAPGATIHLAANLPCQMTLTKSNTSQAVGLSSASLDIHIDSAIDGTGRSTYVVTTGSGQFNPYVFAGQAIGTSTFVVERGSGWIRWSDGVLWSSMRIRASAVGYADIVANAVGPAHADFTTDVVTLQPNDVGVEFTISTNVPAMSAWTMAVFALLMLAGAATLLRRKTVSCEESSAGHD